LALTAQQYAELVLRPTLQFSESLNYQYFDTSKVIRLIGAMGIKYTPIAPDDIVGQKTVAIKLSTDLDDNPGVKRQQLLQFLSIVQQMPPQVMEFHWKLLDKIYKSFFPSALSLADIYNPPPEDEELLEPEEEFELMRQEVPVKVHVGDDDKSHLMGHEKDYEMVKFAPSLSHKSLKLQQQHILDHYTQMTKKTQAQQAQMMAMQGPQDSQGKGQPSSNQSGQGTMIPGQTAGASPFTQGDVTKPGDLLRNMGGK